MPELLKKIQIQILIRVVSKSSNQKIKWVIFQPAKQALNIFALYTMQAIQVSNDIEALKKSLYQNAYQIGKLCKRLLHVSDTDLLRELIVVLYQNIGIRLQWIDMHHFAVSECYFSKYYSADICHVMSNMDAGIISGLLNMNYLQFSQRITEGKPMCKACIGFCEVCSQGGMYDT